MTNSLQKLLDKLISEAPEEDKGAVALQVQIESQPYAGSVRHSDKHPGLYEMIVVDPQQKLAVSIFFSPDKISAVFVPKKSDPIVQTRRSGIIMPGAH